MELQQPEAPRAYQTQLIERVAGMFGAGQRRVLLQSATGSGKTKIACEIVRLVQQGQPWRNVLYVVPRDEILKQTSQALRRLGVDNWTLTAGRRFRSAKAGSMVVGMSQTIARRLDGGLEDWEPSVILIDEAHYLVEQHYKLLDAFPQAYVLGMTATPVRLDGKPLECFGRIVCGPQIRELQRMGFLVPSRVIPGPPVSLAGLRVKHGDFEAADVARRLERVLPIVPQHWMQHARGRRTLTFCPTVPISRALTMEYQRRGLRWLHVDNDTPKGLREQALQALRAGQVDGVCNVGLFVEGLDLVEADCIQLFTATSSLARYLQMVGRGLRMSRLTGKTDLLVLDYCSNAMRLGPPDMDRNWAALAAMSKEQPPRPPPQPRPPPPPPRPPPPPPVFTSYSISAEALARTQSRATPPRPAPAWAAQRQDLWRSCEQERHRAGHPLPRPGAPASGYSESRVAQALGIPPGALR